MRSPNTSCLGHKTSWLPIVVVCLDFIWTNFLNEDHAYPTSSVLSRFQKLVVYIKCEFAGENTAIEETLKQDWILKLTTLTTSQ